MAQAAGFGFDTTFIKRLAEAEEKLINIQKTSNELQTNTTRAFQQVTKQGIVPYVDNLIKQKEAMMAISKIRLSKNSSQEFRDMKQQAKDAVKEINKLVNALSRTNDYKRASSGESAIAFSNSLLGKKGQNRSVENLTKSISLLESAQRRQNTSTREGRKNFKNLNRQLLKTKVELAMVTGQTNATSKAFGSIGGAIATAFSIHSLRGYVNNMVSVRKEFERQQKALQVIIGNKEQANRVWDQTVELAVKSPFTIQELTSYTRQLSAYRIETSKLYETNKMLADVSAGLGVDMSRLILAFGQVKAASFLRGTELRQFTEAGIPMLEELAKHFTELYGRVVTVDQAFEMISKRQVAFKDVEQVFKNMTSDGGVFFNMQEEMSNTIHGRISNLKDSISIMLNDIGQSSEGIIYSSLELTKSLVENWRYVAAAIKAVIAAIIAYQVVSTAGAIKSGALTTAFYKIKLGATNATARVSALTAGLARAGVVLQRFGKAIALNPLFSIATLVATAVASIWAFSNASEEVTEKESRRKEEMEQNVEQLRKKNEQLIKSVNKLRDAFKEAVDSKNLIDQKIQLQKLIDIANEEYRMKIVVDVEGMTPEEMARKILEIGNNLETISTLATTFAQEMEVKLGDKITNQANTYSKAIKTLLTTDTKKLSHLLVGDFNMKEGESIDKYIDRLLEIRENQTTTYNKYVDLYNQSLEKSTKYYKEYKDAAGKPYMGYDRDSFWGLTATEQEEVREFGKFALALDAIKLKMPELKKDFNDFLSSLNTFNAESSGVLDESISLAIEQFSSQKGLTDEFSNYLIDWAKEFYSFDINKIPTQGLKDWQQRYNEYLLKIREETLKSMEEVFGKDTEFWSSSDVDAYGAITFLPLFDESNMDKNRDKMKEMIKGYVEEQKKIIDTYEKGIEGEGAYTEKEYKLAQIMYEQLSKAMDFFGGDDKSSKKKLKEQIELLEEMHKKYLELKKTFGDITSISKVASSYKEPLEKVFKDSGIDFTNIKFDTKKGMVNFLKSLEPFAKSLGKEAEKTLSITIAKYQAEIDTEEVEERAKELQTTVQDIFDQHSISIELKKLQVPKETAKNLFGIDYLDTSELMGEVISTYTKDLKGDAKKIVEEELVKGAKGANWTKVQLYIGDIPVDKIKQDIERVDDIEDKALKERMKKYLEYSRKSLEGAGKIRLEQLQAIAEINEAFKYQDGDTQETKDTKDEEKARALARAANIANEALAKMQWEEFRKSETFTSLFDDLDIASDKVLDDVITRLENFKKQWKDLPIDQMKEVDALLRKAKRVKDADDNPWGLARDLRGRIKNSDITTEDAMLASATAEQKKAQLEEELRMMELIEQQRNLNVSDAQLEMVLGDKYKHLLTETLDVEKKRKEIQDEQGKIDNAQDRIQDAKDLIRAYEEQEKALNEINQMATDLYDSFRDLHKALGEDEDSPTAIFADMGMNMFNTTLQTIALQKQLKAASQEATAFGAAMNTAMGVIGWIVMGVQLLTEAISTAFKIHDNELQKQIDDEIKNIEHQRDLYEEIEEKIENAYSSERLREYNKELEQSIELEIQSLENAIALEKDKKYDVDEEQITAWEKEVSDARKRLDDSQRRMYEDLGGIFDLTDFTKDFIDAWWEAMNEGMSGLDALEEHFEETMLEMVKNQALYNGAAKIMEQVQNAINNSLDTDFYIDEAEWQDIMEKAKQANINLDNFLMGWRDMFGTVASTSTGSLSELQKGIQGVSEETAQIIEGYLNSIRGYVSEQTNYTKMMYEMFHKMTFVDKGTGLRVRLV